VVGDSLKFEKVQISCRSVKVARASHRSKIMHRSNKQAVFSFLPLLLYHFVRLELTIKSSSYHIQVFIIYNHTMAKHLARIHGTEEDKVNCPFYFKIGACRHSDRCSRLHHKPAFSQTLLLKHLYQHPSGPQAAGANSANPHLQPQSLPPPPSLVNPEEAMEDFLCFFEDLYLELSKFGHLEGLYVADNVGDHMIGHVYVKFSDEEQAGDALQVLQGRYYDGRPIQAEFSPVVDFREARCRDYDEESCSRGGFCNFLHVKPVPLPLLRSLEDDAEADRRAFMESQQQQMHSQQAERSKEKRGSSKRDGSSSKRDGSSKKRKHREDRDRHSSSHSSRHHRSSSGSKRSKRHRRSHSGSEGSGDDNDDDRSYSSGGSDAPSSAH
jgi:splicing factor U2AF 35 kDa subunit